MQVFIATDIGGTFSDLVALVTSTDGSQKLFSIKARSTPPHFEEGVCNLLNSLQSDHNVCLEDCAFFIHGSTVTINTLLERKGAATGLITTAGFRDVLEIARGDRPDFFNLSYRKPKPFIERHLRKEVTGRISHTGAITSPLDLSPLPDILQYFCDNGIQSIAVCLLNSYANPEHECAVVEAIEKWDTEHTKDKPRFCVTASHHITREWREYERTSTTVLDAFVKPVVQQYLRLLSGKLHAAGIPAQCPLYTMKSNCGVDSLENIVSHSCISLVESGPAGGVYAASAMGKLIGISNLVALDIGGTTSKCSLIRNGQVTVKGDYKVESSAKSSGYPILVPCVDIVEVGTGGGSIAALDEFGCLHVGPESAGAAPGPVAFGRGGTQPTITDAAVTLGYIDPTSIRCNEMCLQKVHGALAALKDGETAEVTANAIMRLANNDMVNALKLVTVHRGYDPRDFALVAFGGGGPIHACALARELGIKKIIVPQNAATFAAWGMLVCPIRHDMMVSMMVRLDGPGAGQTIQDQFEEMEKAAEQQMAKEGIQEVQFEYRAQMRLRSQSHSIEVELRKDWINDIPHICQAFAQKYEEEYHIKLGVVALDLVTFHLVFFAASPCAYTPSPVPCVSHLTASSFQVGSRWIDFLEAGVSEEAPVYAKLQCGVCVSGPCVVEMEASALVIPPGMHCTVDEYENFVVEGTISLPNAVGDPGTCPAPCQMAKVTNEEVDQEIISHALTAIASEMFICLTRSAVSTIISEVYDCGTGILSPVGDSIVSGFGIPSFCSILGFAIKGILRKFPHPVDGDLYCLNDPFLGGVTHLNDMVLAKPVFIEGQLIGWAANVGHWVDVGGKAAGSICSSASELHQEGIRVPPLQLFAAGNIRADIFDLLKLNSRTPEALEGDLWAQIASCRTGAERVKELATKFGAVFYLGAIERLLNLGEKVTLARLATMPAVDTIAEEFQDDGMSLRAHITITSEEFIIDLRDNCEQIQCPRNLSRDASEMMGHMVFKSLTSPDTPSNGGNFRPFKLLTKEGTLFHCTGSAPQGMYYEMSIRLHDLLLRGLAPYFPSIGAGGYSSICGMLLYGIHPDTGAPALLIEPHIGGWGAQPDADGQTALYTLLHGTTFNCPAEIHEAKSGVIIRCMALNTEEGGEGKYRGGFGIVLEYQVRSKQLLTAYFSRHTVKPWGVVGGCDGTSNYLQVLQKGHDGDVTGADCLCEVAEMVVNEGDVVRVVTSVGAGFGDPAARDHKLVASDLLNGYITPTQAKGRYRYG